jgi:hypothetical protein
MATVFMPAAHGFSPSNTGNEDFRRAECVREGETAAPVTKAEDAAILAKHAHAVIY